MPTNKSLTTPIITESEAELDTEVDTLSLFTPIATKSAYNEAEAMIVEFTGLNDVTIADSVETLLTEAFRGIPLTNGACNEAIALADDESIAPTVNPPTLYEDALSDPTREIPVEIVTVNRLLATVDDDMAVSVVSVATEDA